VTRRTLGVLVVAAISTLGLVAAFVGVVPHGLSGGGTLLVALSSRAGDRIGDTNLQLHSAAGGWSELAQVKAGTVPAAPATRQAAQVAVVPGDYDAVRLAGRDLKARIGVRAGLVEPVLITLVGGLPDAAYAGNSDFNDGMAALQGRLQSLPEFTLTDQAGRSVTRADLLGSILVLAAFHTTCRDTCPLYTTVLAQARPKLPATVRVVEVSTDPVADDPAALRAYAGLAGLDWTLLTGSAEQLTAFWGTFGVQLSGADSHTNFLGVFDAHGLLHHIETGIPNVHRQLAGGLAGQLSQVGKAEAASAGDGWDAVTIADLVARSGNIGGPQPAHGEPAPAFEAPRLGGGRITLDQFRGRPLVLNFWASTCGPCRREMPLLQATAAKAGVAVLLVDERDGESAARSFLSQVKVALPSGYDPDGRVGVLYGVEVLPVTVFIRSDGTIEGRYIGETNATVLADHLGSLGR